MFGFSKTTTGTVLFALDSVFVLTAWPAVLLAARPGVAALFALPQDGRGYSYPLFNVVLLFAMGLYRRDAIQDSRRTFTRIPLIVGMGATLAALASVTLPWLTVAADPIGNGDQAAVFALAMVTFTLCAWFARMMLYGLLRHRVLRRRLLIVGAGQRAWDLLLMLEREGGSLHDDVTLLHHPSLGDIDPRLLDDRPQQILRPDGFDIAGAAQEADADIIIVAPDERRGMDLQRLLDCKKAGFPVIPYLTFVEQEIRRIDLKRMELGWLVYTEGFSFGILDRFLKRLFDLTVSALVLLVTAPLILAGMIAIRCEGPGSVLYRQERVTQDGTVFWILKLRTMRTNAEVQGAVWAARKDSRITRVGAFLRRVRVDELPQLVNILRGEMSFVGPRPERPVFVAELAGLIPLYNERHMVKAGLTGWAQINYPYGASIDDARSKLSYDLYYVKNFSILFDFVILLQTLRVVLWPTGVR